MLRGVIIGVLIILSSAAARAEDSWTYNSSVNSYVDSRPGVSAWCDDKGSTPIYSNSQIEGRHRCGPELQRAVCDASGNRLISTAKAPYNFLDCGKGTRIEIQNINGKIFRSGDTLPAPKPINLARPEAKKEPAADYMATLDQLIDKKSERSRTAELLGDKDLEDLVKQFSGLLSKR